MTDGLRKESREGGEMLAGSVQVARSGSQHLTLRLVHRRHLVHPLFRSAQALGGHIPCVVHMGKLKHSWWGTCPGPSAPWSPTPSERPMCPRQPLVPEHFTKETEAREVTAIAGLESSLSRSVLIISQASWATAQLGALERPVPSQDEWAVLSPQSLCWASVVPDAAGGTSV